MCHGHHKRINEALTRQYRTPSLRQAYLIFHKGMRKSCKSFQKLYKAFAFISNNFVK